MPALRTGLKALIQGLPTRGRYRLADTVGGWLASAAPQPFVLNGVRMDLDHRQLLHRLVYYGLYEENVVNFLERTLKPGDVVLDPGANIGYMAAVMLGLVGPRGQVWSLEPSATAYGRLTEANPHPPAHWHILQAALTDRTGRMTFYDTPRVIDRGFACLEGVFEPKDRMPHEVEVFRLDDLCAAKGIEQIAFLKLDIEGSELPALRGAQELLERRAIANILVETSLEAHLRPNAEGVDALLRAAGYRSYRAERNGLTVPIDVLAHRMLREDIIWKLA